MQRSILKRVKNVRYFSAQQLASLKTRLQPLAASMLIGSTVVGISALSLLLGDLEKAFALPANRTPVQWIEALSLEPGRGNIASGFVPGTTIYFGFMDANWMPMSFEDGRPVSVIQVIAGQPFTYEDSGVLAAMIMQDPLGKANEYARVFSSTSFGFGPPRGGTSCSTTEVQLTESLRVGVCIKSDQGEMSYGFQFF